MRLGFLYDDQLGGEPGDAAGLASRRGCQWRRKLPGAGIKEYGAAAGATTKATVAAAAHSFFAAMARGDYARLCGDLSDANLQQLRAFLKGRVRSTGCAAVVKTLLNTTAAGEARKAASAPITAVRIKGATAFVLFRPKGGVPSYFVMKEEGGSWKATSLGPGAPIEPPWS